MLFVIAACFCWSLVFAVPPFLTGFNPLEIALGRFFVYGFISCSYSLLKKRHLFSKAYAPYWKQAILLASLSTILCYTGALINIRYAGATPAILVFAMTPVVIPLVGNWFKKEHSFLKLVPPLLLMALGIVLAKLETLEMPNTPSYLYLLGFTAGILGIAAWTSFALLNANFLKNKPLHLSLQDWTFLMGNATFFLVLILGALFLFVFADLQKYTLISSEFQRFSWGSILLGSVSTWLSFYLWNKGSEKLSTAVAGQLMITEILFSLLLIYLINQTLPSLLETVGTFCMVTGVVWGCKQLQSPKKALE
jgi:drug/metabolite transporter (DMT)-like permease